MVEIEIPEETIITEKGLHQEIMIQITESIEETGPHLVVIELKHLIEILETELLLEVQETHRIVEIMIGEETEIGFLASKKKVLKIRKMDIIIGIGIKLQMVV